MTDSPFLEKRNRIFENSVGFVIFDKYPVSEGHCLVVPKRLYSNYFDSSEDEIIGLNKLLFKTKKFLDEKYNPSGFNIGINCGKVEGQSIMHCHIHLIPRREGDVENPQGGVRGVIPSKQHYVRKSK